MTQQTQTQTIVGAYDVHRDRTLVIDPETGLGVLIQDEWCGWDSIEGATYRPHLYRLSPAAVKAVQAGWESTPWDDQIAYLMEDGLYNPNLQSRRYYGDPIAALRRWVSAN